MKMKVKYETEKGVEGQDDDGVDRRVEKDGGVANGHKNGRWKRRGVEEGGGNEKKILERERLKG